MPNRKAIAKMKADKRDAAQRRDAQLRDKAIESEPAELPAVTQLRPMPVRQRKLQQRLRSQGRGRRVISKHDLLARVEKQS